MIKGANTLGQFKILQWIEENFESGSVKVNFIDTNRVVIIDAKGESMKIIYDNKEVYEDEEKQNEGCTEISRREKQNCCSDLRIHSRS